VGGSEKWQERDGGGLQRERRSLALSFSAFEFATRFSRVSESSQVTAAHIASVACVARRRKAGLRFLAKFMMIKRSVRPVRYGDFIDLPASIAVSSDKLDYNFTSSRDYADDRADYQSQATKRERECGREGEEGQVNVTCQRERVSVRRLRRRGYRSIRHFGTR